MADEIAPSFNQQLAALDVGASVAVSRRVLRSSPEAGDIAAVKAKIRASVNPAVSKARKKHNAEFCADSGDFVTQDGNIVVVVSVTRLN
jgi:hypothetical protein